MDLPLTKQGDTAIMVRCRPPHQTCRSLRNNKTEVTAMETAQLFFDHVFRHHGLPQSIVSDRDPRFTTRFLSSLFELLGTKLARATAKHPRLMVKRNESTGR